MINSALPKGNSPPEAFRLPDVEGREYLPAAYRSVDPSARAPIAPVRPHNVFIEVTNHCNLLCETCPRTFVTYEEPRTLAWDDFLCVVDQFPDMERAVLHGIGEPLLNRNLPQMIAHLKARGVYVLFNTNATLLTEEWGRKLIEAGLDELRVSIDGANPKTYALIRGAPLFHKVLQNLKRFVEVQRELGADCPRPSLWMTGMKENIAELPSVIRLAASIGVPEVYLQRMVYYGDGAKDAPGMLDAGHGLFATYDAEVNRIVAESDALANALGIALRASGATSAQRSVAASDNRRPWAACMRPWTTAYITANGNALPCCISPFATSDYQSLQLGNVFEQPFDDLWNAERYQAWRERLLSDHPHAACAGCGVHWSL
ncbi:MAG: radical SAM protein [Chloroflexi bacterium]|nr:radical SAM protein [Chloroflexota bacterium]